MSESAVMRSQAYAVKIEHILRNVFECDQHGFGGIVSADYIREHPFAAMVAALAYVYKERDETKRQAICGFIEKYIYYSNMSIDSLLSFESSTKDTDGYTIDLGYKNGEEALNSIITDFSAALV